MLSPTTPCIPLPRASAVLAFAMAALWALLVALFCVLDSSVAAPTAKTKNGTYQGFHLASYNQDLFLGIPYAQPPLGSLRLTNPQSLNSSFNDTKSAAAYFPECVGYGGDDIGYHVSEDCLALNVIRPGNQSSQNLPVAVWIHGGGLQMGGTPDRRYNLSFIVENSVQIGKPIIGVSIAYRLGPWGFLFSQEVQGSGNTNIGLRDQRLALHWIQENIAAFGGDPTKVAIWGESAGAYSVGAHLVAYGGRDDKLFRAGIMESGNPVNYAPYQDAGFYQRSYDLIVNQTGCHNQTDTLNCLRSVPYAKLNAVFNQTSFTGVTPFEAVIDGDFIQKFTSIQLTDGDFVKVPIIDGANTDEGTAFGPVGIENTTQFAAYLEGGANPATQAALPAFFVQELLAAYPDNPSLGIPAELGAERLNATYGEHFVPRLSSTPYPFSHFLYPVHSLNPSLRLYHRPRVPPYVRLCGRRSIHRQPPPYLRHLGRKLGPGLLLPLQRPSQRHPARNRRDTFPRGRVRLQQRQGSRLRCRSLYGQVAELLQPVKADELLLGKLRARLGPQQFPQWRHRQRYRG